MTDPTPPPPDLTRILERTKAEVIYATDELADINVEINKLEVQISSFQDQADSKQKYIDELKFAIQLLEGYMNPPDPEPTPDPTPDPTPPEPPAE